ncbi:MAG: acyl carrier protein [Solirubrobacterales bacterium]|nr:acyl carrier protein [Solirubrobacterales bacterium]
MTMEQSRETIREVVAAQGNLRTDIAHLGDDADLFDAGMSSHASVSVMMGLEDAFDIEFPDEMLKRDVFKSVNAMADAITSLMATVP